MVYYLFLLKLHSLKANDGLIYLTIYLAIGLRFFEIETFRKVVLSGGCYLLYQTDSSRLCYFVTH
jgi:hypothetical protein